MLGNSENPLETYLSEILPDKISINLKYHEQATIWSDIKVIMNTILKGREISSNGI